MAAVNPFSINWEELEWEEVREGIRRKVVHTMGCTITYNEAKKGHLVRPHSHPHEQICLWLSGASNFTVDGVVHHLTAGSVLEIPGGVEHYSDCVSDEPAFNFDIFCPVRPEYPASKKKGE